MSLSLVQSRALLGMQAHPVCVEVHLANGLPSFTLVGLAETEVKEARERVRSAIQNTGLEFPLTYPSPWAFWPPAGRSTPASWLATSLPVSCHWAENCAPSAGHWP